MKVELSDFVLEYDEDIDYIQEVIATLENDTYDILNFFELNKLSKQKRVIIFTDREKYKKHLIPFVKKFKEWMCADTYDGNINLLEISEARKSNEHKNMTLEEFIKCILHEFVHSCQQELNSNSEGTGWYWEALATNLSGQDYTPISLADCDFEKLKIDFYNTRKGYNYSYTLGKYMLENYSKDELLEYVKNPTLLKKDADDIFESAKLAQVNKIKRRT